MSGPGRGRRLQTDTETPSASVCDASSPSQRCACHPQPVPVATAAPTCTQSSVWAPNRADRGRLVSVGGACLSTPTQSRILPSCSSFLRGSTFPHAWSLRLSPDTRGGAFSLQAPSLASLNAESLVCTTAPLQRSKGSHCQTQMFSVHVRPSFPNTGNPT